jgi:hypothetical protein
LYGKTDPDLLQRITRRGAEILVEPSYESVLQRSFPRGSATLNKHPALHKFLNLDHLTAFRPTQILYLDADTILFDDVEMLFAAYETSDIVAREEWGSRRHNSGYAPELMADEDALGKIAASEGIVCPAPFNSGVVLMNRGIWNDLAALEPTYLEYAWRFVVWMALHPLKEGAAGYGGEPAQFLAANFERYAGTADVERALLFPSSNRWILGELSALLTLGHIPGLRYSDFSPRHVLQGPEVFAHGPVRATRLVGHYLYAGTPRMMRTLDLVLN